MEKLRKIIASGPKVSFCVAVLIGIVLSYLHDIVQLLSLPIGEWARVTFIVNAANELLATHVVNFLFQSVTFAIAFALALALMRMLIVMKTLYYPAVAFITHLALSLWWVPAGLIIGYQPPLRAVLPLLPTVVIGSVIVFWFLGSLVVRRHAADQA